MKMAILLSGQPRSINTCYESLKKFYLDKYDCDIFIHTWFDDKFPSSIYGEYINLYKPVRFFGEKQIIFDSQGIKDPTWHVTLQNILSQYYSIFMSNQLKLSYETTNEVKYDIVMRIRSDLQIIRPIEIEKIETGKLALYYWTQETCNDMGSSDVFAIGPSDIMNVYCDLYNKVLYYLYEDPTYVIRHPKMRQEYILNHHLKTVNKLPIQLFWHGDITDRSFNLIQ